jgi:protein-S-isoprenylcysteine O-methyltransferase Ste14
MHELLAQLADFNRSSPRQTFVRNPVLACAVEALLQRGLPTVDVRFVPIMLWGYLQYRLIGDYRQRQHAGPPGFKRAPGRLLESGPYALSRNPMYLGHVIFTVGLALALRSPLTLLLVAERSRRFRRQVLADEVRLQEKFGETYRAYCARVPRWLPGFPPGV